jgi:hypothetical protein
VVGNATELLPAVAGCADDVTLWSDPGPEVLAHWDRHPWPHAALLVRQPDGAVAGAGVVLRSEVMTAAGVQHVATLDRLFLPVPDPGLLQALTRAAAGPWSGEALPGVVSLPNLWRFDPAGLRPIGVRQTGTCFRGHFVTRTPDHRLLGAEGTNLSIDG